MEELKLTGNHLKASRPLLTFSSNFGKDAHWKLIKEVIIQVLWFFLPPLKASSILSCLCFAYGFWLWELLFRLFQYSTPIAMYVSLARGVLMNNICACDVF